MTNLIVLSSEVFTENKRLPTKPIRNEVVAAPRVHLSYPAKATLLRL